MFANSSGTMRGVNEQIAQITHGGEAQRMFVDNIVGDSDDALARHLSDDGLDRRRLVHDAPPRLTRERR